MADCTMRDQLDGCVLGKARDTPLQSRGEYRKGENLEPESRTRRLDTMGIN